MKEIIHWDGIGGEDLLALPDDFLGLIVFGSQGSALQ